jgi:hypothetical protein
MLRHEAHGTTLPLAPSRDLVSSSDYRGTPTCRRPGGRVGLDTAAKRMPLLSWNLNPVIRPSADPENVVVSDYLYLRGKRNSFAGSIRTKLPSTIKNILFIFVSFTLTTAELQLWAYINVLLKLPLFYNLYTEYNDNSEEG